MGDMESFFNTKINNSEYTLRLKELIEDMVNDWCTGVNFYNKEMATFNIVNKLSRYLNSSEITESKEELSSISEEAALKLGLSYQHLINKSEQFIASVDPNKNESDIIEFANSIKVFGDSVVEINKLMNTTNNEPLGIIYSRICIDCLDETLKTIDEEVSIIGE